MATPNKNLNLPLNASTNWDVPLNANFSMLDTAVSATQVINVTGNLLATILLTSTFPIVTTPITSMSYLPLRLYISGNLSQDTAFQIPSAVAGMWVVTNQTDNAHAVSIGSQAGGAVIVVPYQASLIVYVSSAGAVSLGVLPSSTFSIGDYKSSASSAAQPGWLLCYGQAVSRTTYSALFAKIGTTYGAGDGSTTFNIPDRRGTVGAGADNMGGTARGLLPGYSLGISGGAATVSLAPDQNGAHTHGDYGHGHGYYDPTHAHTAGGSGGANVQLGVFSIPSGGNTGYTGIGITISTGYANLAVSGSGNPHNNIQPTMATNIFIYAGV